MNGSNIAPKGSILIVEDEPLQLDSLERLIRISGYETSTATSGTQAIELLDQGGFDAILLDLNIPGVSGYEVIGHVHKHKLSPRIIVVSGQADYRSVTRALQLGAHDFIKKPYMTDELLLTVANVIQRKKLEEINQQIRDKLEQSEYLHRFIVDNSPDIVFMLDRRGHFSFLNESVKKLLGFERRELIGRHYSCIVADQYEEQARYVFMERRTSGRNSRQVELKLKCQNPGEYKYFDTTSMYADLSFEGTADSFKGACGVARDTTERKSAEELINFQAYHDLLTSLPNRALLEDRLTLAIRQAQRNEQKLAVMILDLDRFKWVNDTLGHTLGDRLLQAVSHRLQSCLRKGDTLARFGGDEFALVLPQLHDEKDAEVIAGKTLKALEESFRIDDHELYVTSSIGIAIYPDAGDSMDLLIQSADVAMYHVKDRGKNSYQFFRADMLEQADSRLVLERELRRALETNQLRVCYQPQVDAFTHDVKGLEALVRWEHPDKGLIFPGDFIPLAEETGLIIQLGEFVLETACRDLRQWRKEGLDQTRISINFSARQVDQTDFVERVAATLERHGLPYDCLEVEITENIIMRDITQVIGKLRKLTALGIKVAVDDFGTGYSSLSYLHQFPINTLKIDKSFINTISMEGGGSSIVDAIAAMAKGLRLNMIAEGVETRLQLDYLKQLGCHEIQGFLFGKAENASVTRDVLMASNEGTFQSRMRA